MLAFYLIPVFLLMHALIVFWLLKWTASLHPVFRKKPVKIIIGLIYAFFVCDMYIAFPMKSEGIGRVMKIIGNYWMGITLYAFTVAAAAAIIRFIVKAVRKKHGKGEFGRKTLPVTGFVCFLLIIALVGYACINARNIQLTRYEVTVDKDAGDIEDLNIVLVADLHLGLDAGCSQMEQMVEKINEQDADLVVVAGDIFDNSYENLDDPERLIEILSGIQSKYGVYAVYGNHDVSEPILCSFTFSSDEKKTADSDMDEFMERCGFINLRDEGVMIADSFYLYGRPDYERLGAGIDERKTAAEITEDIDSSIPVIVIDHEPRELSELSEAGVDIDLGGHTHDGQLFPLNIACKLVWENCCGYLQKGDMHSIVTSGVGVYGPFMRLGTKAEICQITVHFNK